MNEIPRAGILPNDYTSHLILFLTTGGLETMVTDKVQKTQKKGLLFPQQWTFIVTNRYSDSDD